jgi:4-alpha-glucanotransferase
MHVDDLNGRLFAVRTKAAWEGVGMRRRSGLAVPLFSVYSKKSIGIGDFDDMKLLIDWCARTGNSILQLLPMNEVGPLFCPYDSISSFALEPMYLALEQVPGARDGPIRTEIGKVRKAFPPGRPHVDYRVKQEKLRILWEIFLTSGDSDSREFNKFIEENEYWIHDFALFKVLKEHQEGKAWYEWEDGFKNGESARLKSFGRRHEKEIEFQLWLQWQLSAQFMDVKRYAGSKTVLVKGDLPVLVSRDSADVWVHPEFFKLDFAAGAPPDLYCAKGQRWGMPTYNWDAIAADDYRYAKEKLKYAENFYDLLRVDHVVGLFRIWSIPYEEPFENLGLNGFFDPQDEREWGDHGRKVLSVMLDATKMLLVAEDLGVIPRACPETLKEFGIPGNDVQRWVKDWSVKHDFLEPGEYRLLSVAMLSTHDTTNWSAWWENEAGTVDEDLFVRKCGERGIEYEMVKKRLFHQALSRHGRLRWRKDVRSSSKLAKILGKPKEDVGDFIDLYENTYQEKEKLWKHLKMKGPMRDKSDPSIMSAALGVTLSSKAIFCVEQMLDWLAVGDILKGDESINPGRSALRTGL